MRKEGNGSISQRQTVGLERKCHPKALLEGVALIEWEWPSWRKVSLDERVLRSSMLKTLPSVLDCFLLPPYQHVAITSPAHACLHTSMPCPADNELNL